jgi:hypothetical protein
VPQGDQFHPVPVDNGDGTYTFFTTAQPGISLPSQDLYWLVLSFSDFATGSLMGVGWSVQSTDDITFEVMYYNQGGYKLLGGRTPMLKLHGCADRRTPSPTPSPSPSRVSTTPSAPPTPSVSASPLACGVHDLANTMVLQDDGYGWLRYYPQAHRLRTNRFNCIVTAFTIKLQDYASTYSPPRRTSFLRPALAMVHSFHC